MSGIAPRPLEIMNVPISVSSASRGDSHSRRHAASSGRSPERRGPRPASEEGKLELTEAPCSSEHGQRNSRRAHGATNKEHHVCARRRDGEAAGAIPLQSAVEGVPREARKREAACLRSPLVNRNRAVHHPVPAFDCANKLCGQISFPGPRKGLNLRGPDERLASRPRAEADCSRVWRRPCVPSRRRTPSSVRRVQFFGLSRPRITL